MFKGCFFFNAILTFICSSIPAYSRISVFYLRRMTIYFLSKITNQGPEDKQDAGDDVGLDCCQPLRLGDVGGDGVEDVDED